MDKFKTIFSYFKLLKKYNTLKIRHKALQQQIKDKCFKSVLEAVNEPKRLKGIAKKTSDYDLK